MCLLFVGDNHQESSKIKSDSDKSDPIYSKLIKKSTKVSTAVGTSTGISGSGIGGSVKEVPQVSDGACQTYDFLPVKKSDEKSSIGTSPPPQSMATQVNKTFK